MASTRTPSKAAAASAVNLAVVANDVEHMKTDVAEIKGDVSDIKEVLQGISRIEERQLNVVAALDRGDATHQRHETRISALEHTQPQLLEARTWVVRGILAGVSLLALGVASNSLDRFLPKAPIVVNVTAPAGTSAIVQQ